MSTLDAAGAIDVHTHVVPPQTPFLDRLVRRDPRWARLERRADDATLADVVVAGRNFRTVRRVAYDLDVRRDEQSALGIGGQVLSAMPELFAPWSPAADATDYSRAFNEWLAAELDRHDGHPLHRLRDDRRGALSGPACREGRPGHGTPARLIGRTGHGRTGHGPVQRL